MKPYFAYWGKARPEKGVGDPCHRLPFHALDVAACAQVLTEQSRFGIAELAGAMGWPVDAVQRLFIFFAALHDIGKFACTFQKLVPELAPHRTVTSRRNPVEPLRHDTLGWLLWRDVGRQAWFGKELSLDAADFGDVWMRLATGHHGRPPKENFGVFRTAKMGVSRAK